MKTKVLKQCFAATFLSLVLLSSISAKSQENDFLKVQQFVLDNGFTVFINEDPNQPQVMGGVVVKAGGKHDPADNTGIAHYLEHMLFKGTTQMGTIDYESENEYLRKIYELYEQLGQTTDEDERKAIQQEINKNSLKAGEYAILNELDNLLRGIGSTRINAFTGEEITFYFNTFPSNQFEKWAEIYSHRFKEPVFRAFQAELEVVYEEKNMYMDNFGTSLFETFMSNFYKNHPYGQQTILGSVEHLKNPSLNAMYDFYNTYYVANNMALVLSGDIKAEDVLPIIEKKFGELQPGDVPEFPEYHEDDFDGRERIRARLTPIKVGILGFRTVPNDHPDKVALDVAINMLSNNAGTGFLDKLMFDSKLMAVIGFPQMANNDYGNSMFIFVPKPLFQSFRRAERLVLNEISKLSEGDFSDQYLQGVKNTLVTSFYQQTEDVYSRGVFIARAFTEGFDPNEALKYHELINDISREDIINVGAKYFGDNYLVVRSRMGFPRKEKLEKPGYDPIEPVKEGKSVFAQTLENMPSAEPKPRFVDLKNDFARKEMNEHTNFFFNTNPLNEIFSVYLRFFVGEKQYPLLRYSSQMMNLAGTSEMTMNEIKEKLQLMGASYNINSSDNYVNINIRGLEKYYDEVLSLVLDLLTDPVITKSNVKVLRNQERAGRRLENADPSGVGSALLEYARKGEKSSYIDRLTVKDIKNLDPEVLSSEFRKILDYPLDIHVSGSDILSKVAEKSLMPFAQLTESPKPTESPYKPDFKRYDENTVLFINKKNALQSQIYIIAHGSEYEPTQEYLINAFNQYFGAGFSGLVMQEIREYRSMAYAAGANYNIPVRKGSNMDLIGFIGTQGDKTIDAIEIYLDLIANMPEKTDRLDNIKESLIQSALTSRPGFRNLSLWARLWEFRGFNDDPNKINLEQYGSLEFDDIMEFYKSNIQGNPYVVCVVGDDKTIDMDALKAFGKFIEMEEADVFSK